MTGVAQGTVLGQGTSVGAQVTGTHSIGNGTGTGLLGEGTRIHGTCAGPSSGASSVRDTGHTEEHEEVAPQEVTLGRSPKWLQETLREAKDDGESERIMQKSKVPERFCSYLAAVTRLTDFEHSSFEEVVDQRVWREAMVEEYDSIM